MCLVYLFRDKVQYFVQVPVTQCCFPTKLSAEQAYVGERKPGRHRGGLGVKEVLLSGPAFTCFKGSNEVHHIINASLKGLNC